MNSLGNVNQSKARLLEQIERGLGDIVLTWLADDQVSDILLNEDGSLWVERFGKAMERGGELPATQAVIAINALAAYHATVCRADCPILSCELPADGSRIEVNVPPIVAAPTFSIRKKASRVFTLKEYVDAKTMSAAQSARIKQAVACFENILVAGSTGSGKTTLANAVLDEMVICDKTQRIFVLEDSTEIQCSAENKSCKRVSEEADVLTLLRSAMRQRPDRIIIGEVRGAVAWDLLKAWNTGHPGGVCTIHAEASPDLTGDYGAALKRLEQLAAENNNCPQAHRILREIIGDTIGIIVYIRRDASTRRRVVAEIVEVSAGGEQYILTPISGDPTNICKGESNDVAEETPRAGDPATVPV